MQHSYHAPTQTAHDAVILFLSDARGIYIPRDFAQMIDADQWTGIEESDIAVLTQGPEHEQYWDTWTSVVDNARCLYDTPPDAAGVVTTMDYRLHQDGDLFLLSLEHMSDEEKENFGFDTDPDDTDPDPDPAPNTPTMAPVPDLAPDDATFTGSVTLTFQLENLPRVVPVELLREAISSYIRDMGNPELRKSVTGNFIMERDARAHALLSIALQLYDIEEADAYGEPGYTLEGEQVGILFANWNNIPTCVIDALATYGYEIEWSDEWHIDDNGYAYRTEPDHYGWIPSYVMGEGWILTKSHDFYDYALKLVVSATRLPELNKLPMLPMNLDRIEEAHEYGFITLPASESVIDGYTLHSVHDTPEKIARDALALYGKPAREVMLVTNTDANDEMRAVKTYILPEED